MGINKVYEVNVGRRMKQLFKGSAKKAVVTTLGGAIEIKETLQFSENSHKVGRGPKKSKTFKVYGGNGGPLKLSAKAIQEPSTDIKVEVEEVKEPLGPRPSEPGTPFKIT